MVRVVFDTVVFVRALINPHSYCGRLLSQYTTQYELIVSKQTMQELLEVIHRPKIVAKYHSLAKVKLPEIIELVSRAEAVTLADVPEVVRDPKDNIFVATALIGRADYLVSEDKDLLVLGATQGVSIVNTETFINLLESEKPSEDE